MNNNWWNRLAKWQRTTIVVCLVLAGLSLIPSSSDTNKPYRKYQYQPKVTAQPTSANCQTKATLMFRVACEAFRSGDHMTGVYWKQQALGALGEAAALDGYELFVWMTLHNEYLEELKRVDRCGSFR